MIKLKKIGNIEFWNMQKKLKKLEQDLKELHYNPPKSGINRNPKRREFLRNFWDYHIMPVLEESRRMAKKYKGDENLVCIGAVVHDVGLIYSKKNHDVVGAKKVFDILLNHSFSKDTVAKASNIILCHRCKTKFPKTLEEKIVITADAIAHFSPAYYLGLAVIANEDYKGMMRNNFEKLIRDFERKIFFVPEKRKFKKVVGEFKKVFAKKRK